MNGASIFVTPVPKSPFSYSIWDEYVNAVLVISNHPLVLKMVKLQIRLAPLGFCACAVPGMFRKSKRKGVIFVLFL